MVLMLAGVLLVVLKLLGVAGFGALGWGWVLAPFLAAELWWRLADSLGWTAHWASQRERERRERRRQRYTRHLLQDPRLRRFQHPPASLGRVDAFAAARSSPGRRGPGV